MKSKLIKIIKFWLKNRGQNGTQKKKRQILDSKGDKTERATSP